MTLAALSFVNASELVGYNYLTQSGLAAWREGASAPSGGTNVLSNETSFTLTLPSASYESGAPYDTAGSLTTATNADGSSITDLQREEAGQLFQAGNSVNLTSIAIFAHYSNNSLGSGDFYLRITDSSGTSYMSSVATITSGVQWDDPWSSSHRFVNKTSYTFDFSGVEMILGDSYTVDFVDVDGNLKDADLSVTNSSDLGKIKGQPTWSPILQVNTTSIIPEPSSATLSLLALSGLLLRRRRRA